MKRFEHPDFEPAVIRAANHFHRQGPRPAIIKKHYHGTKRDLAATLAQVQEPA